MLCEWGTWNFLFWLNDFTHLGYCQFDGMGNESRISWFWSTLDALCIGEGFISDKSNYCNRCSLKKSEWNLDKGKERMTVLISPLNDQLDWIKKEFTGDWRQGKEMEQVIITKRFYQVSSNSSQAWFSNKLIPRDDWKSLEKPIEFSQIILKWIYFHKFLGLAWILKAFK